MIAVIQVEVGKFAARAGVAVRLWPLRIVESGKSTAYRIRPRPTLTYCDTRTRCFMDKIRNRIIIYRELIVGDTVVTVGAAAPYHL
jgi:hypothetical protein